MASIFSVDTLSIGAACCSIVTCRVTLPAVAVKVAERSDVVVFSDTETVISLLPLPELGWIVHQVWLELIDHEVLEVSVIFCSPTEYV